MFTIKRNIFLKYLINLINAICLLYLYLNVGVFFMFILIWLSVIYLSFQNSKYNYIYALYFVISLYVSLSFGLIKFLFSGTNEDFILVKYSFKSLTFGTNNFSFSLYLDFLSGNFCLLTSLLTTIILWYSYHYMKNDVFLVSFCQLIIFFSISMVTLLLSGDIYTFILGWELIGLSSFLLISFWSIKISSLKSSLKALFFNKFSDFCLLFFSVIFLTYNSPDLRSIFNGLLSYDNITLTNNYFLLIIVCSFCKSVQFGFHLWLPDSMEAPIPASSLIHSATLVSAGLYLSIRFNVFIKPYNYFYLWSLFTAFYGSLVSCFQTDVKKILAYSTISHCGYMFFLVFFDDINSFLIYMYLHGFTKALSFMVVGLIIQDITIYQDSRYIYNTKQQSFELFVLPLILLNLSGIPFFIGFFAKTNIVNIYNSNQLFFYCRFLIELGTLFSITYSFNMIYFLFFNKKSQRFFNKKSEMNDNNFNIIYLLLSMLLYLLIFLVIFYVPTTRSNFDSLCSNNYNLFSNNWLPFLYKFSLVYVYMYSSFNYYRSIPIFFIFFYVLF